MIVTPVRMSADEEIGVIRGHLTPAVSDEERILGEGFGEPELSNVYTCPGWPISMHWEHKYERRRVGTLRSTQLNPEKRWLDIEAKFDLLTPASVRAYEKTLEGGVYLSPAFQHPVPGTVTDPSKWYNCLTEVSLTTDPYRKGAVIISAHNASGGARTSCGAVSFKLVPNKYARTRDTSVSSTRSSVTTNHNSNMATSVPPVDDIKKAIVGQDGKVSDESLRAGVTKFGINNAPSVNDLLREAFDPSKAAEFSKNMSNPQWCVDTIAGQVANMLTARQKKDKAAAAEPAPAEEDSGSTEPMDPFKQFYYEAQQRNIAKINEVAKGLMDEKKMEAFRQQLTVVSQQPAFAQLAEGVHLLACSREAAPATTAQSPTFTAPAVSAHSAKRTRERRAAADPVPSNPLANGVQNALKELAKQRNEALSTPAAKEVARPSASGGVPKKSSTMVYSDDEEDDD